MSDHKVSRRPLLVGTGATAILSLFPFKSLAATPTAICSRAGQKAIIKGKHYICVKSKGKLTWKALTPAKPPIILHPSSAPTSSPSKVSGFLVAHISELTGGSSKIVVAKDLHGKSVGVALFLSGGVVSAHSTICTHQGCQVGESGKQLACPCHGSVFDAKSGAVINGPAATPLRTFTVAQVGGELYITSEG